MGVRNSKRDWLTESRTSRAFGTLCFPPCCPPLHMLLVSSPLRAPGIAKARQNSRQALATKKVIRECAFFFPSFFLAGQLAEGWLKADQSCVPAYTQRTDDGARAVFLLCFHCSTEAGRLPIRSKVEVMEKQSCGLDQTGGGRGWCT